MATPGGRHLPVTTARPYQGLSRLSGVPAGCEYCPAGVGEAIKAAGATVRYLPPYSPDLNPIEQVFAKLKAILRRIAARSVDALSQAIATALDQFPPAECTNYIKNSGYST